MESIRTARLLLRDWREADVEAFAALSADPEVMTHYPALATAAQSRATVEHWQAALDAGDFGHWALEEAQTGRFVGAAGLMVPRRPLPCSPCVEVGWRLARAHWGRGYASEAARAALASGFGRGGLDEIVSFTARGNARSRAVMERLGMARDRGGDFEHPGVPAGHPLRAHCLYRLARGDWLAQRLAAPGAIDFRPLSVADLPLLLGWLRRPHVAAWWQPTPDIDELAVDVLPVPPNPSTTRAYLALLDGEPVGFIQSYVVLGSGDGWWEDETDPGARGIDQFLAHEPLLGQGLGRAMVRAFVARLFEDPAVTVVQTDPAPANLRAIAAYRRAGFAVEREVTTPDGPAVLMRVRCGVPQRTDHGRTRTVTSKESLQKAR